MRIVLILAAALLLTACRRPVEPSPTAEPAKPTEPAPASSVAGPGPSPGSTNAEPSAALARFRALVSGKGDRRDFNAWFNGLLAARQRNDAAWQEFLQTLLDDPRQIVECLEHAPASSQLSQLCELVAAVMANQDPEFCRAWAATAAPGLRVSVAAGLLSVWGRNAPQEAARWLEQDSLLHEDPRCCEVLVENWTAVDPADAAQWVLKQPAGSSLESAVQALGRTWGGLDAGAAVTELQRLEPSAKRDALAVAVAEGWALQDADEAIAWFLAAPFHDEAARVLPAYALFSDLAGQDTAVAERLIEGMARGTLRDAAICGLIDTVKVDNPSQAVLWSQRITDGETRSATMETLMAELAESAPDLAQQLGSVPQGGK
jgi:hypothetical protein